MIELSVVEALFISSGFTILGAVIGALIGALATVFSARLSAERHRLYEESARFRSEFVYEIEKLRPANQDVFRIIDEQAMARHRRATILFEPWVRGSKIKAFQRAWDAYEREVGTKAPGSIDNRESECKTALARINSLLSFATHKG